MKGKGQEVNGKRKEARANERTTVEGMSDWKKLVKEVDEVMKR